MIKKILKNPVKSVLITLGAITTLATVSSLVFYSNGCEFIREQSPGGGHEWSEKPRSALDDVREGEHSILEPQDFRSCKVQ